VRKTNILLPSSGLVCALIWLTLTMTNVLVDPIVEMFSRNDLNLVFAICNTSVVCASTQLFTSGVIII